MQTANNNLVLRKDDYQLLVSLLNGAGRKLSFDRRNAQDLLAELKKATLVHKDNFPEDVVRINSFVRIQAEGMNDVMEFMLVMPDKADIKERKISVMAPVGIALIGFKKGQQVKWKVPAGKKTFTILDVVNDE
ncbi:GreA/GreB family elongation factor [Niastella populi]|uniref:Transcription elongation factor GreA/GreB C-terminal domain-containing protein n=1 Tax=Niastella populi TaxID=550983 RepID=A0A1V9FBY7_9BACT|nr:GreA/GreB family elongation factor [Niastella populi]OQP55772.1 hypothetical protein A4R26_27105 [Niastella populi]